MEVRLSKQELLARKVNLDAGNNGESRFPSQSTRWGLVLALHSGGKGYNVTFTVKHAASTGGATRGEIGGVSSREGGSEVSVTKRVEFVPWKDVLAIRHVHVFLVN